MKQVWMGWLAFIWFWLGMMSLTALAGTPREELILVWDQAIKGTPPDLFSKKPLDSSQETYLRAVKIAEVASTARSQPRFFVTLLQEMGDPNDTISELTWREVYRQVSADPAKARALYQAVVKGRLSSSGLRLVLDQIIPLTYKISGQRPVFKDDELFEMCRVGASDENVGVRKSTVKALVSLGQLSELETGSVSDLTDNAQIAFRFLRRLAFDPNPEVAFTAAYRMALFSGFSIGGTDGDQAFTGSFESYYVGRPEKSRLSYSSRLNQTERRSTVLFDVSILQKRYDNSMTELTYGLAGVAMSDPEFPVRIWAALWLNGLDSEMGAEMTLKVFNQLIDFTQETQVALALTAKLSKGVLSLQQVYILMFNRLVEGLAKQPIAVLSHPELEAVKQRVRSDAPLKAVEVKALIEGLSRIRWRVPCEEDIS